MDLAKAFEATWDEPVELPEVCSWRGCTVTEPLVLVDHDGWCLAHAGEDALPPITSSSIHACAQCGRGCATEADGVPLHARCRRDRMARRASAAKPKGAYARRRQTT